MQHSPYDQQQQQQQQQDDDDDDDDIDYGLRVTVTPSQSAFFAGEIFSATISFSNPSPQPQPQPTLHSLHSLSHLPTPKRLPLHRQKPPSASHLGLAEYASSHLDSDEVPPSPFIGSSQDAFSGEPRPFAPPQTPTLPPERTSTISTASGGALPTPISASFTNNNPLSYRSVSGTNSPATSSKSNLPGRKGLIGKPLLAIEKERKLNGGSGGLYSSGPRRPHGRTQSLAVSSPDLLVGVGGGKIHGRSRLGGSVGGGEVMAMVSMLERKHSGSSVTKSGRAPPPIEKSLPSSQTSTPSTSLTSLPSVSQPNHPYSRKLSNALSSTFSLAEESSSNDDEEGSDYDPSDSTSALPNQGFYGIGRNDTMESVVKEGLEDWTRRTTSLGSSTLHSNTRGQEGDRRAFSDNTKNNPYSSYIPSHNHSHTNSFFHPPNTITVLWSFAHLEGTFEVEDLLIKPAEFVEIKRSLLGGGGLGGGTLDENPSGEKSGGGWRDWLFQSGGKKGGATLKERKERRMREKSVPTFSSPPSILGVDLVLEPGQSKAYTFSIRVPADLPPSFRGKAIKFSYHLVVGTNRSQLGPMSPAVGSTKDSISRVMRVPVRMYNHVGITGARPFYDLTNPIVYHRDEAKTSGVDDVKTTKKTRRLSDGTGRQEFAAYAAALLGSLSLPSNRRPSVESLLPQPPSLLTTLMEAAPSQRPEMGPRSGSLAFKRGDKGVPLGGAGAEEDQSMNCKAAVEIVSRNSQKVSYDINKDGYLVASLTLVKSSYRLGETVNGSVVVNSGEGRVLRISARLETHELIETSISKKSAPQVRQITRRLHSEHHETTLDSARIGFALAIPSGATPDFATSGVKLQWSVRLSFLVIPPSPDAPLPTTPLGPPARSGRSGAPSLPPPPPSPTARHGRSKSFAYGFEPAVPLTLPAAPLVQPTGAAHLMPVYGRHDSNSSYTTYRAVPDLGYVPVLYCTTAPEAPPTPGPLQRSASGASHKATASLALAARPVVGAQAQASVVLVPAKVETVECSIPIKVYPGNTPFRPTLSIFSDTN